MATRRPADRKLTHDRRQTCPWISHMVVPHWRGVTSPSTCGRRLQQARSDSTRLVYLIVYNNFNILDTCPGQITLDAFTKPNLLVLGQSQDPTLPKVSLEIRAIHRIIDDVVILDGDSATRDSALQAMAKHSWAHFACHGNVDEERPFKTHFSLFDGPLTLLDIASQNTPDAYLAFLSSCHSAEGNRKRPDEALHLTAGVQFAGFKSVIGTLWAVDGADGPAVAETFYSNLLGRGPKPTKSPAVALHRAVRQLRRKKEGDRVTLTRWACFVHYGC